MIKKAFDKLTHISADDKTREEYDAHMCWQLSQKLKFYESKKQGREEGLKEGVEKGIKNAYARMVRQLMVRGADVHLIAEITELPPWGTRFLEVDWSND